MNEPIIKKSLFGARRIMTESRSNYVDYVPKSTSTYRWPLFDRRKSSDADP